MNISNSIITNLLNCIFFITKLIVLVFLIISSIFKSTFRCMNLFLKYKDITEDVILITGAGRGLGRSLALKFTKYKPKKIILWDVNEANLKVSCSHIKYEFGVDVVYSVCDITDYQLVDSLLSGIRRKYGGVSILVNNAGVLMEEGPSYKADIVKVERLFKINTFAQINLINKVLPLMLTRSKGHIVQISSVASLIPIPFAAVYSSSKFAITGYMDCLRTEVHGKGVNTSNICPSHISTSLFNGLKMKLSKLIPAMTPDYVAQKTVEATLTNSYMLILPRPLYFIYFVKQLLPIETWGYIERFLEVDIAMNSYRNIQNE